MRLSIVPPDAVTSGADRACATALPTPSICTARAAGRGRRAGAAAVLGRKHLRESRRPDADVPPQSIGTHRRGITHRARTPVPPAPRDCAPPGNRSTVSGHGDHGPPRRTRSRIGARSVAGGRSAVRCRLERPRARVPCRRHHRVVVEAPLHSRRGVRHEPADGVRAGATAVDRRDARLGRRRGARRRALSHRSAARDRAGRRPPRGGARGELGRRLPQRPDLRARRHRSARRRRQRAAPRHARRALPLRSLRHEAALRRRASWKRCRCPTAGCA